MKFNLFFTLLSIFLSHPSDFQNYCWIIITKKPATYFLQAAGSKTREGIYNEVYPKIFDLKDVRLIYNNLSIYNITQNDEFVKGVSDDIPEYKEPNPPRSPTTGLLASLFKTLLILLIFIFVLYYFFKFIIKKQKQTLGVNTDLIELLAYAPLAGNRFLQIVKIGKQVFVIGNTEHNINLITEITDSETIEILKSARSKIVETKPINFSEYIMKLITPFIKKRKEDSAHLDFIKKQTNKLKKLQ